VNIIVLTNFSERIAALNRVTSENKRKYCDQNGYGFVNLEMSYDEGQIRLLEILKNRLIQSDMVMSMGCDTAFTNFSIRIEDRAFMEDERPVISEENLGNNPINNDVMIWKNNSHNIGIIDAIIDHTHEWITHGWRWQNFLSERHLDKLRIAPARHMNSTYLPYERDGSTIKRIPCASSWEPGDWVMHSLGFPTKTRTDIILWALEKSSNPDSRPEEPKWED